jgi:acyl carrier protein
LDIVEQIKTFIVDNFMLGRPAAELGNDDSLLDKGIIDSTGVLELVSFVEQTFGITVADEDLVPENLDSVNRLEAYIKRKKQK